MLEPEGLASSRGHGQAQDRGPVQKSGLWKEAPAWRNLTLTASGLTVAALALSLHSAREAPAPVAQPGPPRPATTMTSPAPSSSVTAAPPVMVFAPPQLNGPPPQALRTTPPAAMAASRAQEPVTASAPIRTASIPPLPPSPPQTTADPGPALQASPKSSASSAPQTDAPGSQTAQDIASPQTCRLRLPGLPTQSASGTVLAVIPQSEVLASIPDTELVQGGKLDPAFKDTPRVKVRLDNGGYGNIAVPEYLQVHIGDQVTLHSGYRNMKLPCNYVPATITADKSAPTTSSR